MPQQNPHPCPLPAYRNFFAEWNNSMREKQFASKLAFGLSQGGVPWKANCGSKCID